MESIYKKIDTGIKFPEFKGGLLYMYKTDMSKIVLPEQYKRYTESVEQTLRNVKNRSHVCYITIDEKTVCGATHRREGIHVDYNWYEKLNNHGGGHGHKPNVNMGGHDGGKGSGGHGSGSGSGGGSGSGNHAGSPPATHSCLEKYNRNGGMLLVSNYEGCKVYRGKYNGVIGEGGDCRDIDVSALESEVMKRNDVYFLNPIAIHEPLVITEKINRSLIRINFHPDYIFANN